MLDVGVLFDPPFPGTERMEMLIVLAFLYGLWSGIWQHNADPFTVGFVRGLTGRGNDDINR